MPRILIAGYQHETNTFAPSLADWAAFTRGDSFPAFCQGAAMQDQLASVNIPIGGFIEAAKTHGWTLLPSCWAGAIPSSFVTTDAFERIAGTMCQDVRSALAGGLDGLHLDLHGAAVAQNAADSEGELLARLRAIVGPKWPIVASLDLHANVTHGMLREADALVSYRTYPHVDMAATDELAARAAMAAGLGAELDLALGTVVPTFTVQLSDPPVRGRYKVRALSDGRVTLKGPMMRGLSFNLGPSVCLEIDGIRVAVVSGKKQLLDRELLPMVGMHVELMRLIVVKSANHFRADFQPIASSVLVAKAAGPMAADPADLPWRHLPAGIRLRP